MQNSPQTQLGISKSKSRFTIGTLMILFFVIGFVTTLNDILIPHLKVAFDLNNFQASLIQFCFFITYILGGVFGRLINKIGYPFSVTLGFLLAALGCILFYPAAQFQNYTFFLGALFLLAMGIVLLQTVGNPYVTLLAPNGKEASVLTLVQACNSIGTTVAPHFGALLILSDAVTFVSKIEEARSVQVPYLGIAGFLIILAFIVSRLRLPDVRGNLKGDFNESSSDNSKSFSFFHYPHLCFGAGAIFCYVGAEVAIGSFLILTMREVASIPDGKAALYLSYYWGLAMIGRFLGSLVMVKVSPHKCLVFNSIMAFSLIIIAILMGNEYSIAALIAIGLFNSIMFPTIFSLSTKGLGEFTSRGSGLISMAIVGGAIVPPIQGFISDHHLDLLNSYIVAAICYVYIFFFAIRWYKPRLRTSN